MFSFQNYNFISIQERVPFAFTIDLIDPLDTYYIVDREHIVQSNINLRQKFGYTKYDSLQNLRGK